MAYGDSPSRHQAAVKPMPKINALNRQFWEYARRHVYALQYCDSCGDAHVPESPVCPRCLSEQQSWRPVSGKGTLESWVDFHRAYWDGFGPELPYRACLVRLDEGPLIVSNLVGEQSGTRRGARLHVVFESIADDLALPKFALDDPLT